MDHWGSFYTTNQNLQQRLGNNGRDSIHPPLVVLSPVSTFGFTVFNCKSSACLKSRVPLSMLQMCSLCRQLLPAFNSSKYTVSTVLCYCVAINTECGLSWTSCPLKGRTQKNLLERKGRSAFQLATVVLHASDCLGIFLPMLGCSSIFSLPASGPSDPCSSVISGLCLPWALAACCLWSLCAYLKLVVPPCLQSRSMYLFIFEAYCRLFHHQM